jgi:phosphoglycolate phosphatase-like HAD superfamily hydrolase
LRRADDSPDRREIFQLAATRRSDALGGRFTQVVLVGDGVWDVRVAGHLGWSFVGVGRGVRAARLLESGAATVLEGFVEVVRVEALLRTSTSPVWRDVSLVSG